MSKSKRNTIDPEKIMDQFGADAVRFLYCLTVHLKKTFSGLSKVWLRLINLFKNFGYYIKSYSENQ